MLTFARCFSMLRQSASLPIRWFFISDGALRQMATSQPALQPNQNRKQKLIYQIYQ